MSHLHNLLDSDALKVATSKVTKDGDNVQGGQGSEAQCRQGCGDIQNGQGSESECIGFEGDDVQGGQGSEGPGRQGWGNIQGGPGSETQGGHGDGYVDDDVSDGHANCCECVDDQSILAGAAVAFAAAFLSVQQGPTRPSKKRRLQEPSDSSGTSDSTPVLRPHADIEEQALSDNCGFHAL